MCFPDTYKDAERWIAEKNNRRSSVPDNSAKKKLPWDYELRYGSQKYSSVSKDKSERAVTPHQIPRKQFSDAKDKESLDEEKKQLYLKRLNLVRTETVKSTVQNTSTEPVSSITNQSITIGDKQPIENVATNDAPKTEDSTHSSKRTNSKHSEQELIMDVDAHTEVNVKDQSQQEQHRETRIQNQLAVPKSPSPVEQIPQNRHDHPKLRVKNIQDRTAPFNNLERVVNVSNERPFTSQHLSNSLTMSAELWNQTQSSRRNKPIERQNALIEVDPTKPLPQPLTKSSTANIQKARQGTSLLITNNINRAPAAGMAISSQDIQHVAAMIPAPPTPKSIASVTSPESYIVTHQQFSFAPEILQQNLPNPQEHKQTREQDLAQRNTAQRLASRRLENHPSEVIQHQPIRPPVNNDPTNIPSQFYQPLDNQPRVQRVVTHQDAQQRPASTSTLQRNNRRSPTLQGVQKTTPPPASPKAPKSITQILVNALENYQWNEQQLQVLLNAIMKQQTTSGVINGLSNTSAQQNHSPRSPEPMGSSYQSSRIEPPPVHRDFDQNLHMQSRSDETNSTRKRVRFQDAVERDTKQMTEESGCSTDVYMEESMSSPYGTASDSGVDTDHEAISGYEMSVDEAHDAANDIEQTEYNSVDRSQNSSSKLELQQQMMERFSTVCTTLNSSLRSAASMLDNLRDSIREISKSPQTYFDNQRFDMSENSVSHSPSYSNVIQEVPPVVEEKQISAAERRNSSNGNQQNDSVNNAPERIHIKNSREHPDSTRWFVLPSEYHPNNTKWTLKYEEGMPGVVELMPRSKIYVKFNELKHCEQVSTSCESLAQLMLHEVFNEKALSVCASMRETAKAHYQQSPDARPPLDNHGSLVLLNYVIQYGIESGWSVNEKKIFQYLDHEIREMRFKYGLKFRYQ